MKNNKWQTIWENKNLESLDLREDEFEVFCALKKMDGFDVSVHDKNAYYKAFYDGWFDMYTKGKAILQGRSDGEDNIESVYEVGCGSGVNLYLFKNRIEGLTVGGIDYSQNMIEIANRVVDSVDLVCGEVCDIDETRKYDWVMSESVFQYFRDEKYAEDVLEKMIHKAKKLVYIAELREEWLAYRRASMKDYDKIYEGLDKTFYNRAWIANIVERNQKNVLFTKSDNPEYWNNKFVYNCFIY